MKIAYTANFFKVEIVTENQEDCNRKPSDSKLDNSKEKESTARLDRWSCCGCNTIAYKGKYYRGDLFGVKSTRKTLICYGCVKAVVEKKAIIKNPYGGSGVFDEINDSHIIKKITSSGVKEPELTSMSDNDIESIGKLIVKCPDVECTNTNGTHALSKIDSHIDDEHPYANFEKYTIKFNDENNNLKSCECSDDMVASAGLKKERWVAFLVASGQQTHSGSQVVNPTGKRLSARSKRPKLVNENQLEHSCKCRKTTTGELVRKPCKIAYTANFFKVEIVPDNVKNVPDEVGIVTENQEDCNRKPSYSKLDNSKEKESTARLDRWSCCGCNTIAYKGKYYRGDLFGVKSTRKTLICYGCVKAVIGKKAIIKKPYGGSGVLDEINDSHIIKKITSSGFKEPELTSMCHKDIESIGKLSVKCPSVECKASKFNLSMIDAHIANSHPYNEFDKYKINFNDESNNLVACECSDDMVASAGLKKERWVAFLVAYFINALDNH